MRIFILGTYVFLLSVASGAAGTDYFPLTEGVIYEFEYNTPQLGGTYIKYFSGTAEIGGETTHVLHIVGSDSPFGRLHFWSETVERDKLFHGAHTIGLGTPLLFSPPILMIDAPLFIGKTWVVDSRDSDSLAVRFHFEVTAFGEVTVPAGTFQAFTIRSTLEFPEGNDASKFLARIRGVPSFAGTAQQGFRISYADGIGQVLEVFGSSIERLLSIRTIAIESVTWTRIRMLYR